MPDLPIEESTTGYATILSKTGPKGGVSMVKSYRQCHPFSDEYSKEAPPTIVSANENETIPPSKGGKENVEQDRNGSIMGLLAQEMPKGLPANERRRRSKPRQRPGMDKYWKLFLTFLVATGCLTISMAQEGAVGSPKDAQTAVWQNCTCFPCMDITCQNLKTIYGPDDTLVYQRNQNENFSECSTISFSPNTRCNVCLGQGIIIICSTAFKWLDVEGDTSEKIYPKVCPTMEKVPANNTILNSDNNNTFSPQITPFLTVGIGTGTCFPCMDITCQHLKTIYGPDDTLVYQRNHNENFSECSTISFSPNTRCNVCLGQGIIIICSKPFKWLDVEGDTSEKIYPKACPSIEKDPGNNTTLNSDNTKIFSPRIRAVLLLPLGIFTVAAIVLMVCCCREEASKKSGARNVSVV